MLHVFSTALATEMFVGNGKRSSSQERPLQALDGQDVREMPEMTQTDDQYPDSALIGNEDPLDLDSSPMIARLTAWLQNRRIVDTSVRHCTNLPLSVLFN